MENKTEKVSEEVENAIWGMMQYSVKMAVKQPKRIVHRDEFFKLFYEELAFQRLEFENIVVEGEEDAKPV